MKSTMVDLALSYKINIEKYHFDININAEKYKIFGALIVEDGEEYEGELTVETSQYSGQSLDVYIENENISGDLYDYITEEVKAQFYRLDTTNNR